LCADEYPVLLRLFVDTSRPYLEMIDGWMTRGVLKDPFDEFMIKQ
jgi:hypothetical protein